MLWTNSMESSTSSIAYWTCRCWRGDVAILYGDYIAGFIREKTGYINNTESKSTCSYCPYTTGADYLGQFRIDENTLVREMQVSVFAAYRVRITDLALHGGITASFCVSSYALVLLMMKLRTKSTKTASWVFVSSATKERLFISVMSNSGDWCYTLCSFNRLKNWIASCILFSGVCT